MPRRAESSDIAAVLALFLLGGAWIWWTLKFGAYFGTVFYPGVLLLAFGALVLILAAPWRASLALSGPIRLALWGLIGLGAWTLASVLWSPTPDIAVADAQRVFAYGLAFMLGAWSVVLLGRRMELGLLPLVVAAGVAGIVTAVWLASGSDPGELLRDDATLEFPFGYRNATAAFFLLSVWPALALATSDRVRSFVRVPAFAIAVLCAEFGFLSQSRGAIPAAVIAAIVFVATSPKKATALVWVLLTALIALPVLPASNDLFSAGKLTDLSGVTGEMNAAGVRMLIGFAVAFVIAIPATRMGRPSWFSTGMERRLMQVLAVGLGLGLVIGLTQVPRVIDKCSEGEPDFSADSTRFSFDAGSNRCTEVWPVAFDAAADDPLFGEGAGGFRFRFDREREDPSQLARDAHSVELEMLSELGVVGLALLAVTLFGAFAGPVKARRLGPAASQLSAGALACGAYWLVHSSIDWFWSFPAITAPVFALLGAATAPSILVLDRVRAKRPFRGLAIVSVVVLALSVVPPLFSLRYEDAAISQFQDDPEAAYDSLDRARALNPLADSPYLVEGTIARQLGNEERAIEAFRAAVRERPEEYAGHFFLAEILAETNPDLARTELAVVLELNPLAPGVNQIRRAIEAAERSSR